MLRPGLGTSGSPVRFPRGWGDSWLAVKPKLWERCGVWITKNKDLVGFIWVHHSWFMLAKLTHITWLTKVDGWYTQLVYGFINQLMGGHLLRLELLGWWKATSWANETWHGQQQHSNFMVILAGSLIMLSDVQILVKSPTFLVNPPAPEEAPGKTFRFPDFGTGPHSGFCKEIMVIWLN